MRDVGGWMIDRWAVISQGLNVVESLEDVADCMRREGYTH